MPQILRPIAITQVNQSYSSDWLPSAGSELYSLINEETDTTTTYIYHTLAFSQNIFYPKTLKVFLNTPLFTIPTGTGSLKIKIARTVSYTPTSSLRVYSPSGSNLFSFSPTIGLSEGIFPNFVTKTFTITSTNINKIRALNPIEGLYLTFETTDSSLSSGTDTFYISDIQLEIPATIPVSKKNIGLRMGCPF